MEAQCGLLDTRYFTADIYTRTLNGYERQIVHALALPWLRAQDNNDGTESTKEAHFYALLSLLPGAGLGSPTHSDHLRKGRKV